MSTSTDNFSKTIRKIESRVEMSFYENSEDNDADVSVNWKNTDSDFFKFQNDIKNQIISSGLCPERKCATADGLTLPNGTAYSIVCANDIAFPIWSDVVGNSSGEFDVAKRPIYTLDFVGGVRKINFFMIIGEEKWNQGPLRYYLHIYQTSMDRSPSTPTELPGYTAINLVTVEPVLDDKLYHYKYEVILSTGKNPVKQVISLPYTHNVIKAELEIAKWSVGGTTSKIMFFTNDMKIVCQNNQVESISVLEEKSASVEQLDYGITTNSCNIKVKNDGNRFIANKDLLKRNRIIKPFVKEAEESSFASLGKFYSTEWEVSSSSEFVGCKAYDILFNLQNIYIYYELEHNAVGNSFDVDGKDSASCTAQKVLVKLFALINAQRKDNGIFGNELEYEIDPELNNVVIDYVCLGYDTAWNMLSAISNATQSFTYCNREGKVVIRRDFKSDISLPCSAEILPSNSFSYNLPTMSQTIINRVLVPYFALESVPIDSDRDKDDKFTIKPNELKTDEDGNKIAVLELKNFYTSISGVERYADKEFKNLINTIPISDLKYTYNKIFINMKKVSVNELYLKVIPKDDTCRKKLQEYTSVNDDFVSQRKHGVATYELNCKSLVYGEVNAKAIAKAIYNKYGDGKSYIETDWRGTPHLLLGDKLKSRSKKDATAGENVLIDYECISNEFSIGSGLKVKTKARRF